VIRLVVFDLDGTLAASKQPVGAEIIDLLHRLLDIVDVAIISGGDWSQFQTQLLVPLGPAPNLDRLSLLPTSGTKFFAYGTAWQLCYEERLTDPARAAIIAALVAVSAEVVPTPAQLWGPQIEDRGTQITYSGLGQSAPGPEKARWDPDRVLRTAMIERLARELPDYAFRIGGSTSIDVTRPGIDKGYGIERLAKMLKIPVGAMIFIGDALFPGGNDAPARNRGVTCISVRDPRETAGIIETVLATRTGVGVEIVAPTAS
jgi:HAD superfamily hydrolase (TIGR01484 family)